MRSSTFSLCAGIAILGGCGSARSRARDVATAPLKPLERPAPRSEKELRVEVVNASNDPLDAVVMINDLSGKGACAKRTEDATRTIAPRGKGTLSVSLACRNAPATTVHIYRGEPVPLAGIDFFHLGADCSQRLGDRKVRVRVRDADGVESTLDITPAPYVEPYGPNYVPWAQLGAKNPALEADLARNRVRSSCRAVEVLRGLSDPPLEAIGLPLEVVPRAAQRDGYLETRNGFAYFTPTSADARFHAMAEFSFPADARAPQSIVRCDDAGCAAK